MDNMLGGGGGAIGQFPLEQWFYEMPVCTRWWTAATVATSLLVQCHIITPFQLFYSFRSVFVKNQVCHLSSPPNGTAPHNWRRTILTVPFPSSGGYSPHSFTSAPYHSIFSSTSSSCKDILGFSKNHQGDHLRTSHGCCSTQPRLSFVCLRCCPCPS